MKRFSNRREAGRALSEKLLKYSGREDVIVLALPRGGVPVAYEVGLALKLPVDVWIVRKLGLPGHEELAIGAIASGGTRILNTDIIRAVRLNQDIIDNVVEQELQELKRREGQYRGNRPALNVHDRTVIVIDDGLATGATMLAASRSLRTQNPARLVVAVPTAAPPAVDVLQREVDELVFVIAPYDFKGVGNWYEDFSQTTDEEVQWLLAEAERQLPLHDETDDAL